MLGEGVVARAAVRLRVQETLALLWTRLEPVPLVLPLRPCEAQQQSEHTKYCSFHLISTRQSRRKKGLRIQRYGLFCILLCAALSPDGLNFVFFTNI